MEIQHLQNLNPSSNTPQKVLSWKAAWRSLSESQWEISDNLIVPQDDLYTPVYEWEIGGPVFDTPSIRTYPNARDFDESQLQGTNTVFSPTIR